MYRIAKIPFSPIITCWYLASTPSAYEIALWYKEYEYWVLKNNRKKPPTYPKTCKEQIHGSLGKP